MVALKPSILVMGILVGALTFALYLYSLPPSAQSVGKPCGAHTDLAYVHLAQFEPTLGGMSGAVEIVYVASDGIVQISRETTDDQIQDVKIGRISLDQSFFDLISNSASAPLPVELSDPNLFYDGRPARTRLLVCTNDGSAEFWEGDSAQVTKSITRAIAMVKEAAERATPQAMGTSARFLRARQLNRNPSQLSSKSYIVPDSRDLKPEGLLVGAIKHPYRLIPISEGDDLPFAQRRQPDRPVSVVIQDAAYRFHFLRLQPEQ